MGISFAIPIDEATRVSDQLRATGKVSRGRIGVEIDQVSKEVAESIGLGKSHGALVRSVVVGSPAEKAGIEAGDIITKFDGKAIEKSSDLPRIVGATKPGTKSVISIFRRGTNRDVTVIVAEIEAEKPVAKASAKEEKSKPTAAAQMLGLTVADLTDAQKKELGIKGGVRVEAVSDAAARAQLREGDIILAIATNVEIMNIKELETALSKIDKSKPLNVLFRRGNWTQYAIIKLNR
jgi:serine protease Do